MSWVKLDDAFVDHPKVIALSNRAFRLHVTALCYCSRFLTDGIVPEAVARDLARQQHDSTDAAGRQHARSNQYSNTAATLSGLVAAGLWEVTATGYRIHDYLDYNPSREQVLRERAAARERKRVRANSGRSSGEPKSGSGELRLPRPGPSPKDKEVPVPGELPASAGARAPSVEGRRAGPDDPLTPISELLNPWARYGTADEIDTAAGIAPSTPVVMANTTRTAPAPRRRSRPPDPRTPEEKRIAFRQQIAQLQQEPQAPTLGTNGKSHDPE